MVFPKRCWSQSVADFQIFSGGGGPKKKKKKKKKKKN